MPHTPVDDQFLPFALGDGLNRRRHGFKPEWMTDVALTEEMRARSLRTPQQGNTTSYTNPLRDGSPQSENKMRCPHNVYNPQLPSKDHSCEEMFSNIDTLKSHIRQVHNFRLKGRLNGSSQQENYESIWKELFAGYRGTIPPACGLSPDDMRRMQNLRMFEVIEGYIWNQMRQRQSITREELEIILNSFRSKSSFLLITEATGFSESTATSTVPAPANQHQRSHKPKRYRGDTIPHGHDSETIHDAAQNPKNKREGGEKASCNDRTTHTTSSIDQRKVADIMEKYRELTQSCSDPEYEDDEIGEEETSIDQLNVDRTGKESIRTLNSPNDVGEGPGNTRNGTDRNGRSWTASAHGSTNRNFKRGHSRSSSGGNDDEDSGRKRRKHGNIGSRSIDKSTTKFACPYAKHAPDEPYKAASCCYPGFPTVSRVKEHIYRTHAALIQCPRCFKSFGDEDGLTTHLRDTARCPQLQDKPDTKTITVEQERKLRSKMKSDAPEEVKWRQVYRIVFNLDDTNDTPNPYNDRSSSVFQLFSRYEKHCREALPSLVENEIRQVAPHSPISMGEGLKSTLVEIVLKCQESLFASFRGSEAGAPRQPVDPDPLDGQYNYMDFPLLNSDMWEFNLEGAGLGEASLL